MDQSYRCNRSSFVKLPEGVHTREINLSEQGLFVLDAPNCLLIFEVAATSHVIAKGPLLQKPCFSHVPVSGRTEIVVSGLILKLSDTQGNGRIERLE